jgi:uncharacterized protein YndB with AHSA1/START domain
MKNLKTIELEKEIKASATTVFLAIKSGLLFKSTGITEEAFENDFRENGTYRLRWKSGAECGGKCEGRYVQIVPNQLVSFTWNSTDCKGATNRDTLITVTLKEQRGICFLKLVHEGLEDGFSHEDHLRGWITSLEDFPKLVTA